MIRAPLTPFGRACVAALRADPELAPHAPHIIRLFYNFKLDPAPPYELWEVMAFLETTRATLREHGAESYRQHPEGVPPLSAKEEAEIAAIIAAHRPPGNGVK